MTTIKIYDGNSYIKVEVEDEFAITYNSMEKRDALDERRETRRHQSLNASIDNGFDFPDKTVNIEEEFLESEQHGQLHKAIAKLLPEQQWLIKQIYFNERTQIDIANELGIGESAIRSRLKKIFEKIKKSL